jgi:hypothetical protein
MIHPVALPNMRPQKQLAKPFNITRSIGKLTFQIEARRFSEFVPYKANGR